MPDKLNAVVVDLSTPIKALAIPEYKVDTFHIAMLPAGAWRDYVSNSSECLQSSPDYVAVTTVIGFASVIGARVRIQPKPNNSGFKLAANLSGALIGSPASRKSPALTEGLRPFKSIEREFKEVFEAELKQYKAEKRLFDIRLSEAEKLAAKCNKAGKDQEAFGELALAIESEPEIPAEQRLFMNDPTVPMMVELMRANKAGLGLIRDELSGLIANLQNESNGGDRALYLEAMNGTSGFTQDRIGRGTVHIANCCLSIIGCIQPPKIAPVVADAVQGKGDDGLLQRFQLAVWPDSQPYPEYFDAEFDNEPLKELERIVSVLVQIDPDEPRLIRFDDTAQSLFIEWWNDLSRTIDAESSDLFKAFLIKQTKTLCSLATIFALVEDPSTSLIDSDNMVRAAQWCEYLRSHARKLYRLNEGAAIYAAMRLALRCQDLPETFTIRDVYKKSWGGLSSRSEAKAAVDVLLQHGYLIEKKQDQAKGGRPTDLYCFNPNLENEHFDFDGVSHE